MQEEEITIGEILDNRDRLHSRDAVGVDKEDHKACPFVGIALSPPHIYAKLKRNGKDPDRKKTEEEDVVRRKKRKRGVRFAPTRKPLGSNGVEVESDDSTC